MVEGRAAVGDNAAEALGRFMVVPARDEGGAVELNGGVGVGVGVVGVMGTWFSGDCGGSEEEDGVAVLVGSCVVVCRVRVEVASGLVGVEVRGSVAGGGA